MENTLEKGSAIYIFENDIEPESIKEIINKLYSLINSPEVKTVTIKINSDGGSLTAAIPLINSIICLKQFKPIIGINMGVCLSAAFDIFCVCSRRISFDNAIFMYHNLRTCYRNSLTIDEIKNCLNGYEEKIESNIESLLMKKFPKFKDIIDETHKTNMDIFLSPQKLEEFGIVTDIITVLDNDEDIEELGDELND